MTVLWPARIVTPTATYEPAHCRFELDISAEVLDKAGVLIEQLEQAACTLIAEGEATGSRLVKQRWQITGTGNVRWLAELVDNCGCGTTRVTASNPVELAW